MADSSVWLNFLVCQKLLYLMLSETLDEVWPNRIFSMLDFDFKAKINIFITIF